MVLHTVAGIMADTTLLTRTSTSTTMHLKIDFFYFSTPSFFMAILRCFGSGLLSTNVGQDKVELILFVLQIVLLTLCGLFKRNCTLFSLFVLFLQMK